jgi:hypothetical protein
VAESTIAPPPRRPCHRNAVRGAAHQGPNGVAGRAHRKLAAGVTALTTLAFDGTNNVGVLMRKPDGGSPAA